LKFLPLSVALFNVRATPALNHERLAAGDLDALGRIELFRDLTPDEWRDLGEALHSQTFPAGRTLMAVEQPGEAVYFILSGTVKVHVEQETGADVIISILGPGDSVGEMSLLDQQGRSASVVTIEESELLWMDRATFRRFLMTMPGLAYNLARILSARLRLANEQIQSLAAHEAESRVARHLLAFARRYGEELPDGDVRIPVRLTQSDTALPKNEKRGGE
jgi:CRP/FNR family cyclic AMP-dependent transcriptional regulator